MKMIYNLSEKTGYGRWVMKGIIRALFIIMVMAAFAAYGTGEAKSYSTYSKKAAFQNYKAVVTASKVYIRKTASSSGKITGAYYKGNIIDIIGVSGRYLKTSKGYILASYVQKYIPPKPDIYIKIDEDTPLLINPGGSEDERYAVSGKVFKVLEQKGAYYKIKIGKVYGYIPSSKASILKGYVPKNKITLGWMYINGKQYNAKYMEGEGDYINKNSASVGIDIISPTWFDVAGSDSSTIDVIDKADRNYTKTAHRNGYEVWARIYETNVNRAKLIFNDAKINSSIIDKIVKLALDYDVDGVNIDFEGLGLSNKDGFTAFVAALSQKLKANGISVSVDITKPEVSSYNFYDRAALSKYCDYMILMAYGEHGSSLSEAGSAASYQWVEKAVIDTINLGVPKDKLILGVPFYTYDYAVIDVNLPYDSVVLTKKGEAYNSPTLEDSFKLKDTTYGTFKFVSISGDWYTVEYNGSQVYIPVSVSSYVKANTKKRFVVGYESMKLQTVYDRLLQYNGIKTCDTVSKQYVGEYYKDGLKHVVWVEDKDSMAWRMDLVSKYGLKGAAAWQLYWETPEVLDTIKAKLE